ncbi:MAG: hypothetical protein ABI611_05175 [Solirubrobacteraceae bacterium]
MTPTRRLLVLVLAFALLLGAASPARAQDNSAVAENTTDGSSVFQLAFDIRETMQPVVEETNTAIAYSNCDNCRTVAIAIQIVLVMGDVTSATPQNVAVAVNEQCTACETFAAAYQFVLSTGGPVRFTKQAQRELHEIKKLLQRLGRSDIPLAELDARLKEIKARIKRVLETGLEPVPLEDRHRKQSSVDRQQEQVDAEQTPAAGQPGASATPQPGTAPAPAGETPTPTTTPTPSSSPTATPTATPTASPTATTTPTAQATP